MANELNQITVDTAGTSWVDPSPAAVSTGYQAQNINIQARSVGQDLSSVRVSGTDIIVDISGPIDVDGLPFSLTSAVTLTPSSGGVFYIQVVAGATIIQKSLELTATAPVWDAGKNALYNSGNRVLNWQIFTDKTLRVNKLVGPENLNTSLGSTEQTIGGFGFTRWLDVMPLTYPYYFDSFTPSEALQKICVINGDLYGASVVGSIYHYAGISGTLLETISGTGIAIRGISYDDFTGNLLLCSDTTLYIMDGISASVLSSFALTSFTNGITVANGNLISVDGNIGTGGSNFIRIHDGVTSTVLTSLAVSTFYIRGVTFDGNNIICGGLNSGSTDSFIYVTKGQTSDLHITLDGNGPTSASGISGLAHDGRHLIELNQNNNTVYVHGFI